MQKSEILQNIFDIPLHLQPVHIQSESGEYGAKVSGGVEMKIVKVGFPSADARWGVPESRPTVKAVEVMTPARVGISVLPTRHIYSPASFIMLSKTDEKRVFSWGIPMRTGRKPSFLSFRTSFGKPFHLFSIPRVVGLST